MWGEGEGSINAHRAFNLLSFENMKLLLLLLAVVAVLGIEKKNIGNWLKVITHYFYAAT